MFICLYFVVFVVINWFVGLYLEMLLAWRDRHLPTFNNVWEKFMKRVLRFFLCLAVFSTQLEATD